MTKPPKITKKKLKELDEFLMSEGTPENCLQLSDLDGFLTGIIVGPELIMPSEWMQYVWGGGEPEFDTEKQAQNIMGTIMARYNEIIHQLDDEPGTFEPILYSTPDGSPLAADWAEGFMDAFGLRVDAWDDLLNDENDRYLMGPIMAFLHDKDGKPLVEAAPEDMQKVIEESAAAIPYAIKDIYEYWKKSSDPIDYIKPSSNDNARPFGKKVGRNEPCPCGSGRKYKRCCGSN